MAFALTLGATCFLLSVLGVGEPAGAQGSQVRFRVAIGETERTASIGLVTINGLQYVSLKDLVGQLGGGYRVFPERVQVDLARQSAWMRLDETQVDASLNRFSILHPVVKQGDAALMALSDVGPFFTKAFRLSIQQDSVPASRLSEEPVLPESTPAAPASLPPLDAVPPPLPASSEPAPAPRNAEPVPLPEDRVGENLPPLPPAPETPQEQPATPLPAARRTLKTVIIDPGHGGNDSGCEGAQGLREKDLTLALALRLEPLLAEGGRLAVRLTRREDRDLSMQDRATVANSQSGDLLISLHGGASFAPEAQGFDVFCPAADAVAQQPPGQDVRSGEYAAQSRAIAEAVAGSLAGTASAVNRGVHGVRCPLLDDAAMPAILIEVGFLTNGTEEGLLRTEDYQARIAQGIAAGIEGYLANPQQVEVTP